MGSRFNVFFADKYDAGINGKKVAEGEQLRAQMDVVVKAAIKECIAKAEACWQEEREECLADGDDVDASSEFEFEGYSGDIASGEAAVLFCDEEFTVTSAEERLIEEGNDALQFPYDETWFKPLRHVLETHCKKFGPSLCVRINGRWAIMGFYSD